MAKIVSGIKRSDLNQMNFVVISSDDESMLIQDISRGYSGIGGGGLLLIQAVPASDDRAELVVSELARREVK